jgi:hypothetical protein
MIPGTGSRIGNFHHVVGEGPLKAPPSRNEREKGRASAFYLVKA